MPSKVLVIGYLLIGKSSLPNLSSKSELFAGAKREAALNELHGFFKTQGAWNCHQNVNMIWHDNEVVDLELSGSHVGAQDVDKKIPHPLCLEQWSAARSSTRHKECPRPFRGAP